ncbi:MAG TPA: Tm-1-like ATP-binding domain-containing protein, partial [Thermodesulfobacteriota bacterium]|nr:Tm-1-like ATP-binding domain-containing protein [Thermodesulfobacteriota bacterium]
TIVLVSTLDTKGIEAAFLKTLIQERGHRVILLDTNTGGESSIPVDLSAREVAKAAGWDIEEIRKMKDTNKASSIIIEGAIKKIRGLFEKGDLDGIVSFGGASNTAIATAIMKSLPFGIPKVMLSSTAAMPAYAGGYFGTKDIAMIHSVVDIAGLNPLVEIALKRAAGAVCGMVEMGEGHQFLTRPSQEKGLIALTEFKFSEECCSHIRRLLQEKGFEVIPFHAQGTGDKAMEELIGDGFFQGVMDIVPAGVGEELLGGNRTAGPNRLETAGKMGIPQIIAPCGFDMLSCGPLERGDRGDPLWVSKNIKSRKLFIPDAFRVQARTNPQELREIAREVAKKLNQAKGPIAILIPLKGWSSLDQEGMPLYDPVGDRAFLDELKIHIDPKIPIVELDLHLNNRAFAQEAVNQFLKLLGENKIRRG